MEKWDESQAQKSQDAVDRVIRTRQFRPTTEAQWDKKKFVSSIASMSDEKIEHCLRIARLGRGPSNNYTLPDHLAEQEAALLTERENRRLNNLCERGSD